MSPRALAAAAAAPLEGSLNHIYRQYMIQYNGAATKGRVPKQQMLGPSKFL